MSALAAGRKHMAAGAAALKTSLFKWSPDYVSAAYAFEKAAVSFKAAGDPDQAGEAARRGASAHSKTENEAAAAKCLELAADALLARASSTGAEILAATQDAERAAALLSEASGLYRVAGELSKAANVMSSKAKALETAADRLPKANESRAKLLQQALEAYLGACDLLESSGRVAFSLDTFRHALNFVVKAERWADALLVIDRLFPVYAKLNQRSATHKARLSKVILNLKRNDLTAARNAFREGFDDNDYLRSDECAAAEDLVRAWESMNEDQVREVTNRPVFKFLDRQLAILAQDLSPYNTTTDDLSNMSEPLVAKVAEEISSAAVSTTSSYSTALPAPAPLSMPKPPAPETSQAEPNDSSRMALFARRPAPVASSSPQEPGASAPSEEFAKLAFSQDGEVSLPGPGTATPPAPATPVAAPATPTAAQRSSAAGAAGLDTEGDAASSEPSLPAPIAVAVPEAMTASSAASSPGSSGADAPILAELADTDSDSNSDGAAQPSAPAGLGQVQQPSTSEEAPHLGDEFDDADLDGLR